MEIKWLFHGANYDKQGRLYDLAINLETEFRSSFRFAIVSTQFLKKLKHRTVPTDVSSTYSIKYREYRDNDGIKSEKKRKERKGKKRATS